MSFDRVLRAGLASLVLASSAASAQTPIPASPDPAPAPAAPQVETEGNPLANRPQVASVLRFLQAQGVKLTTLGTEGGLPAYLGESPNGRMQVFYVTPDGTHVIAGLMFDSQGSNITGLQLGEMQRRFEAAQRQIPTNAAPSTAPSVVPGQPTIPPSAAQPAQAPLASQTPQPVQPPAAPQVAQTPPATGASQIQPQKAVVPTPAAPVPQGTGRSDALGDAAGMLQAKPPATPAAPVRPQAEAPSLPQQQSAAQAPSNAVAAPSTAADRYVSALDRGSVERALKDTPWFVVGVKEAPAIYMVADPQCQYCHAAWQRLQSYVYGKKLQIRVIMIAGLKGSQPQALSILSRGNPGEAWLAGEGSVNNFAVAPPPAPDTQQYQTAQKYLDMNAAFVRTFGISSTPTFLYFGKDQRLYSSIGLPDDADAFMAAL